MGHSRYLEFANFVCKFGKKNLLDYANSIVLPAFEDRSLKRKYGRSEYFFTDVRVERIEDEYSDVPILYVSGRFIQSTVLERTQIFEDGKLIQDEETMESAPSAVFGLILNNHKLLYLGESKYAPSVALFRTTIERFLRIKHAQILWAAVDAEFPLEKYYVKTRQEQFAKLNVKYPAPKVDIVPLPSKQSVGTFIDRFANLKVLEVDLVTPNDEIHNAKLFDAAQESKDDLSSLKTKIVHQNAGGLDKVAAKKYVVEAAKKGNAEVIMEGIDTEGRPLRGTNDSFKIRLAFDDVYGKVSKTAKRMLEAYHSLVASKTIRVEPLEEVTIVKIRQVDQAIQAQQDG